MHKVKDIPPALREMPRFGMFPAAFGLFDRGSTLKPFEYVAPSTAEEAVAILAKNGTDARLLAGGTDYLVELKHATDVPKVVVDVSEISEFKGIELTDKGLRFGSGVTHTEIMESDLVAEHALAMQEAALTIGAVQTRNLGTLGGNLVTCVPSVDSGPVLIALDAAVTITGSKGIRIMPLLTAMPSSTINPNSAIGPAVEVRPVPENISAQHEPITAVGKVPKIISGEASDSNSAARIM